MLLLVVVTQLVVINIFLNKTLKQKLSRRSIFGNNLTKMRICGVCMCSFILKKLRFFVNLSPVNLF